jgi:diaminopimelate epimerase
MGFDFYKIHGTGNDFIAVDNRQNIFPSFDPGFIKNICTFHTGIGADGLLLLENSDHADFRMRYFNSDGYESDMCVNGSRCICYIAFLLQVIDKKHSFEAGDGVHYGEIVGQNLVKVEVKYHKNKDSRKFPVDFKLPKSISFVDFIDTGVPHVVLSCNEVVAAPVMELGNALRFHPYYAPEGTNVNFVEVRDTDQALLVRTFERGVDAETLSCGSGVAASVLSILGKTAGNSSEIIVRTNGGNLSVTKDENRNQIFLEGPVKIVYKGTYIEEEIS